MKFLHLESSLLTVKLIFIHLGQVVGFDQRLEGFVVQLPLHEKLGVVEEELVSPLELILCLLNKLVNLIHSCREMRRLEVGRACNDVS